MCSFQWQPEISLIEINFSCPNKPGEKIISKDLKALDENLGKLNIFGKIPIGVKLPYYGDTEFQKRVIDVLFEHNISFATMINGILGLDIDTDTRKPTIRPNGGRGAISGQYIQQLALLEVYNFYQLSKGTGIDIIGVGGISTGNDAYKFLLAGARAVEVGSQLVKEGVGCIGRINSEFTDIITRKHTCIDAACGSLQQWEC
jgi:dihydroorotate dehydrogenase (fumarate)